MKKLFAVLAIAGALVACNNNSESTTTADSTVVTTDTNTTLSTDTTTMMSDTMHNMNQMDTAATK